MHARKVGDGAWLVVLARDERVVANLVRFAEEKGIEGGWVQGLGSIKGIELGYYDLARRTYLRRKFEEDMELSGCAGNLGMAGDETVLHCHASVSGPELISFSGHLFEARVAVTAEFLVRDFGLRLDRAMDSAVGLKILQPPAAAGRKKKARGRKGAGA